MFDAIPDLIDDAKDLKNKKANNQTSLFDLDDQSDKLTTIKDTEWTKKEKLERERANKISKESLISEEKLYK